MSTTLIASSPNKCNNYNNNVYTEDKNPNNSSSFLRRLFPSSTPKVTSPKKNATPIHSSMISPSIRRNSSQLTRNSNINNLLNSPSSTTTKVQSPGQRTLYSTNRPYLNFLNNNNNVNQSNSSASTEESDSTTCRNLKGEFEEVAINASSSKPPPSKQSSILDFFSPVFSLFQAAGYFKKEADKERESQPQQSQEQQEQQQQPQQLQQQYITTEADNEIAEVEQCMGSISVYPTACRNQQEEASQDMETEQVRASVIPETDESSEGDDMDEDYPEEEEEDENSPYAFMRRLPYLPRPSKSRVCIPPKSPYNTKPTLVLDLDETLVHCSTEPLENADLVFPVVWSGIEYHVFAKRRPYLDQFLERASELFEIVVFTASQQVYADKLLDILDPCHKYFTHRVFREGCVCVEGNYLKDLTILGRDLATTVIIDNSPQAFGYQYNNGIPILSWFDSPDDTELYTLIPFIERLSNSHDVRPILRAQYKLYRKVERH